jgi:hypothetical protein
MIGEKTMLEIFEALGACGFPTVDRLRYLKGQVERGEEKINTISLEVLVQLGSDGIGLKLPPFAEGQLNRQTVLDSLFPHPGSTPARH